MVSNLRSSGSTPCLALSYQLVQCWVLLRVVRLQILWAEKGYGKYDFVVYKIHKNQEKKKLVASVISILLSFLKLIWKQAMRVASVICTAGWLAVYLSQVCAVCTVLNA